MVERISRDGTVSGGVPNAAAASGCAAEEYDALRRGAGFVVRSDRGRIAAVGADRLTYLHAMLTNDVASLRPGAGCYAAYLTPQGRLIADMVVLELGDLTLLD